MESIDKQKTSEQTEPVIDYDHSIRYAIHTVKTGTDFSLCWPPRVDEPTTHLIVRDILWMIALWFPLSMFLLMIRTAYQIERDPLKITAIFAEIAVSGITVLKIVTCRVQRPRVQAAIEDLYHFIDTATIHEKEVLGRCLQRCTPMYVTIIIGTICASTAFGVGPFYLETQLFPTDIVYPAILKPTEPKPRAIIYLYELTAMFVAGSALLVDLQVGMLLWFYSVRFNLVAEEFEMAANSKKFDECIKKHQILIQSVGEIIDPARYVGLELTAVTILGSPCCAYQILADDQVTYIRIRFAALFFITCMEILLYAWPADHLMANSGGVAYAAYCSPWMEEFADTSTNVLFSMMRAQKQITLQIDGVLPALNLDFYGKFLTTSFSYFTTLRAVTGG